VGRRLSPRCPPDRLRTVGINDNHQDVNLIQPQRFRHIEAGQRSGCRGPSQCLQGRGRWFEPSSAHRWFRSSEATWVPDSLVTRGPQAVYRPSRIPVRLFDSIRQWFSLAAKDPCRTSSWLPPWIWTIRMIAASCSGPGAYDPPDCPRARRGLQQIAQIDEDAQSARPTR
jgi:hypothetical protein